MCTHRARRLTGTTEQAGGKSGGYRTLVFFRHEEQAIFAFGFAKSDKANLGAVELQVYKHERHSIMDCATGVHGVSRIRTKIKTGRYSLEGLLGTLRDEFRRQGVTAAKAAGRLGISEATAKRWLRGQGLTLEGLQDLGELVHFDLRDLIEATEQGGIERFTLAQERVLASDRTFAFLFFSILNGWQVADFQSEFELSPDRLESYLQRLVRLHLIARNPDGRVKPIVGRAISWRRDGPLIRAFDEQVKPLILDVDLGGPDAKYITDVAKISEAGREKMLKLFEELRLAWYQLAEEERLNPSGSLEWSSLFLLVRPFDMQTVKTEM